MTLPNLGSAVVAIGLVIVGSYGNWGQKPRENELSDIGRKHIAELISTLPAGTPLRLRLEAGEHGDGVRQIWMDLMKRQGVKRAIVSVRFANLHQPHGMTIERTLFFDGYDTDCAQITDVDRIETIEASELGNLLKEEAISRTQKLGKWILGETPEESGLSTIEFYDDEWLWSAQPVLSHSPEGSPALSETLRDEAALHGVLAAKAYSQQELDQALMYAAAIVDDSCILKPLLKAGANSNAVNSKEGNTALMNAAGAGQLRNVRVLLEAGADPNRRDLAGRTALSMAKRTSGRYEIIELLMQVHAVQ